MHERLSFEGSTSADLDLDLADLADLAVRMAGPAAVRSDTSR
jgi:hypothetical protein